MVIESRKNKMESIRELINEMIVSEKYDSESLVKKPRTDELIVQAMKGKRFLKGIWKRLC